MTANKTETTLHDATTPEADVTVGGAVESAELSSLPHTPDVSLDASLDSGTDSLAQPDPSGPSSPAVTGASGNPAPRPVAAAAPRPVAPVAPAAPVAQAARPEVPVVGAAGTFAPQVDSTSLSSVVRDAAKHQGAAMISVQSESDAQEVRGMVLGSEHPRIVQVNKRQGVRALWRKMNEHERRKYGR